MKHSFIGAILPLLLLLVVCTANATTCAYLKKRYFILCINGKCEDGFQANDIPTEPCERKPKVGDLPPWVKQLGNDLLATNLYKEKTGIFQLSDDRPYFFEEEEGYEVFIERTKMRVSFKRYIPPTISLEKLFSVLNEIEDNRSGCSEDMGFRQIEARADKAALNKLREEWVKKGWMETMKSTLRLMMYWGASIFSLVSVIFSTNRFYRNLSYLETKGILKAIKWPILIQFIILLVSVISIYSMNRTPWLMAVFAPFIIILWIIEFTQVILMKLRKNT